MAIVIYNAKVYVERDNFAQAVLVEDGLIRAVGTNEEVLAAAPADAERYDAAGRTVVPGFNDSHQHLYSVGTNLESVDVHGVTSIADVKRITRAFIEKNQPAPGSVVYGSGWNQDYFTDESRLLTRQDLDEISTDLAIVLERACGHILVANTRAIELAGITKDSTPVAGGAFDYDADGELTGIFRENACNAFTAIKAEQTVEMVEHTLRTAMAHAAECGVTSVQTMDVRPADWPVMLEAYKRVQQDPTVRVYHQCNFQDPESFQRFLDAGYKTGVGDAVNKIGPLKLFVDGSLGARTALMREPYCDDPSTSGIATLTQQEFNTLVAMAAEHGCQVVTHAIGDGAIELVLNGYDTVCKDGENPLRLGVVHCQITDRPLVERFAENDILALVQPIFLHYDMTVVEDRVGKELSSTSYAFESMRRLGIHMSFGTDSPVEDMDPIDNLYCAVTRKNLNGQPEDGFYPGECVDICDAVDAYTAESAYVSFEEDVKGRIKPGYYADLVVLSEDIFTMPADELRRTKVDATMMGGRFVYQR
ncbi:amidohydrolase [Anaerofilum sp. BX8]|uniref:Amidohydrolase n=1 Tax=Anaerofilum hominis TaxID=2763016 RepID=A0A923I9V8_9FIRM|nr:amidohydrolase [Anaerofilum hominis]MBC5581774.1 amidohydrolase [Anaerofilum hominis]